MKKILVLGAGMVGRAIIYDLSRNYEVIAVDIDEKALNELRKEYNIESLSLDASQKENIIPLIEKADFVVSAVPGFMGYKTLETIIECGKNVVDISFMPEDFMQLTELAREKQVIAVADCGVAPGMPNIIAGYYSKQMKINNFEYYVGGLPKERAFPFEYKAPFSPIDVIEEYTRPARAKRINQIVTNPAMSDPELMYFKGVGHLEAFNTDGLRSLLFTLDIPDMKEKTLRYPGHIKLVSALIEAGFFDRNPIFIDGNEIRPVDFTNKILFKNWKLKPDEEEFTVMRVILEGVMDKGNKKVVYDLFDEYDTQTQMSSMARTTGYTATAAANLILEGHFDKIGVHPPEFLGMEETAFHYILDYLSQRNINYQESISEL